MKDSEPPILCEHGSAKSTISYTVKITDQTMTLTATATNEGQ